MAELVTCASCGKLLRIPDELVGKKVKCPDCGTAFDAHPTPPAPPPPAPPAPQETVNLPLRLSLDDEPRAEPSPPFATPRSVSPSPAPPPTASEAGEEDLRPCPHCGERVRKMLRRCPYCEEPIRTARRVRDEEDEDEDERRFGRRRRFVRYDGEPHRGPMVLVFGIISVVFSVFSCCGIPGMFAGLVSLGLGIPAWVIGRRDLRRIREGEMDPAGEGQTQAGMICGIVGTCIAGTLVFIGVVLVVVYIVAMVAAGVSGAAR
jgi:predicted RNA-binding Zn-ribbon protein involved in translation (DUF1610 family)